jgi:hypothetical protein
MENIIKLLSENVTIIFIIVAVITCFLLTFKDQIKAHSIRLKKYKKIKVSLKDIEDSQFRESLKTVREPYWVDELYCRLKKAPPNSVERVIVKRTFNYRRKT